MKADIDSNGILVVTPESSVEAYALNDMSKKWAKLNKVTVLIDETEYPKIAGLKVDEILSESKICKVCTCKVSLEGNAPLKELCTGICRVCGGKFRA